MDLRFWKINCGGNDFVLFYNINKDKSFLKKLTIKACDRHYGVGGDGAIFIKKIKNEFYLDYFNSDASSAFCGNGTRGACWWLYQKKYVSDNFFVNTISGRLRVVVKNKKVYLTMPQPQFIKTNFMIKNDYGFNKIHFIKVGVPHLVIEIDDVNKIDVLNIGRFFRNAKELGRDGANVNFVKVLLKKNTARVFIRTYERGVEDETLSCSTGITSSFWALNNIYAIYKAVFISKSNERFEVKLINNKAVLTGPNEIVFDGRINI